MTTRARRDLTALRLTSLAIAGSTLATPADAVRYMLAMQAQDFSGAKWSIGLRVPQSTDATVQAALASGEIVRTWLLRGTLHVLAPEDVGWMLGIIAPRHLTRAAKRRDDLGITDRELALAGELTHAALEGGRVIRRDDLLAIYEAAGMPVTGQRGYHFLWNLGQQGLIVFGPTDGKQPTFTLLEEWVTAPRQLDGDEALAELAARYFASHGPATDRDLAWWASITLSDARRGMDGAELEKRDFDGTNYYVSPGLEPARKAVHALPGFDEFMLGYQDRSAGLRAEFADRIVPGNNGVFLPTVVVDGDVVGTWRRTETTRAITVEIAPFEPLTARTIAGFERAIARYAKYMGKPVTIR